MAFHAVDMPSAAHSVLVELTPEEIEHRLDLLRNGVDPDAAELLRDEVVAHELAEIPQDLRLYDPWVNAADEYIAWSQHPERRVYTGIEEFDAAMRGLAPSELLLVVGYAHSGKTVYATQVMLHNHDKRVALFTPDETRVLVLVKMASILHGVSAEELEDRLAASDPGAEELLRDVARQHFPQFAVFDEISALSAMDKALDECEQVWGAPAQLVAIDYLDLVSGEGEDLPGKMNAVKSWGKRRGVPLIVLHQASRSAGAGGQKMGISSGGYGGEQQATFLVGVRRKRDQFDTIITELDARKLAASQQSTIDRLDDLIEDARYERERHRNTITFSLLKNKRPPSRLVEDTDFLLDADTGRIDRYRGEAAHAAVYDINRRSNHQTYEQGAMQ